MTAIRKATDELQRATHALAELLYKGSSGPGQAGPTGAGNTGHQGSDVKDGEVVDAEYAETR